MPGLIDTHLHFRTDRQITTTGLSSPLLRSGGASRSPGTLSHGLTTVCDWPHGIAIRDLVTIKTALHVSTPPALAAFALPVTVIKHQLPQEISRMVTHGRPGRRYPWGPRKWPVAAFVVTQTQFKIWATSTYLAIGTCRDQQSTATSETAKLGDEAAMVGIPLPQFAIFLRQLYIRPLAWRRGIDDSRLSRA